MLTSLMSTAVATITTIPPTFATPVAIDASIFKNGYSLVTYKFDIPESGELHVKEPPKGNLGTVWLFADQKTKINAVTMTSVDEEIKNTVTVSSLIEVIINNKGKTATLAILNPEGKLESVKAKIIEATAQITVIQPEGSSATKVINASSITSIELPNATYTKTVTTKNNIPALRINASPKGQVYMFALQQGLNWVPAYNIDISDTKKLTITAKSTVNNQLVDLNIPQARFVAGFPNISFLGTPDPLTVTQNIDNLVQNKARDLAPGASLANQRAYIPAQEDSAGLAASFTQSELQGFQSEDMYFYQQPNLNLKKGENGYYVLFQSESEYSHLYTLDIPQGTMPNRQYAPTPPERTNAWHKLKFKNTTGRPLTTATATIMQKQEMLGQDIINYTPNGAEVLLPITQSLDIASIVTEEETDRQVGVITRDNTAKTPLFDRITVTGKIALSNYKDKDLTMRVTKEIYGEAKSATDAAEIVNIPTRTSDNNGASKITWNITLKKTERKTLTYTYTLLVQTRG